MLLGAAGFAAPAPAAKGSAAVKTDRREWTVMYYTLAKDELQKGARRIFDELKSVGSTDKVAVVERLGLPEGTALFYIRKNGADKLASLTSSDMGNYKELISFIKFVKTRYPAKRYALVLSGHGSGVQDQASRAGGRAMLYDGETGSNISTRQLRMVFEQAGNVDILALNSCFMQMAESVYEIKDHVKAVVGSEEALSDAINVSKGLLVALNRNPDIPPVELGKAILKDSADIASRPSDVMDPDLNAADIGIAISVIDTTKMQSLPQYLDNWTSAMLSSGETNALEYAITNAQRFGKLLYGDAGNDFASYTDLYNFVTMADSKTKSPQAHAAAASLKNFITAELVPARYAARRGYEVCGGVSIRMLNKSAQYDAYPNASVVPYPSLSFSRDTQWDEFLTTLGKTHFAGNPGYNPHVPLIQQLKR